MILHVILGQIGQEMSSCKPNASIFLNKLNCGVKSAIFALKLIEFVHLIRFFFIVNVSSLSN